MDATPFTPVTALVGGALIGLSATVLMLGLGRLAGISGILRQGLFGPGRAWRLVFLLSMAITAGALFHFGGLEFTLRDGYPRWLLLLGGLFVGYGTALGSGCTSGHGVCGLARFSGRSLVATLTFLGTGMLTVFVVRHLMGGAA